MYKRQVVLSSKEGTERGILSNHLHSDGRYADLLYVDGGPSTSSKVGFLKMDGQGVFKHAVKNLSAVIEEALEYNNLSVDDIDWFIPHQANIRILESVAKKVGLSQDKIKKGDLVLLEAMGGGFSWGSTLIRW